MINSSTNLKLFSFTLDLESDYGGVIDCYEIFRNLGEIERVLSSITELGVKITVFVVGEVIEKYPEVIEVFKKYNCEFEPHSYSHDFRRPDTEEEIEKSKKIYIDYFGREPKGYRAPRGLISHEGIQRLEKKEFLYDSSVFPSFFPNPFRYLLRKRDVHEYEDSSILEIPLTSVTPLRITLSASYIKLLGINFFKLVSLPDLICFDSHLHDFIVNDNSFNALPFFWRLIYNRNKFNGVDYCVKFLEHVKQRGYTFCYMSDIYECYK